MVHLRLRRLLPFLRVLALALFALGLVLQPVMAAVGEMHELAHDPSGTHSHDLHVDELDAELAAAGEQNQGGAKRSEEQTSELQSLMRISYAVFCLKQKHT